MLIIAHNVEMNYIQELLDKMKKGEMLNEKGK